MTILETLQNARRKFIAGEHRSPFASLCPEDSSMLDLHGLVLDSAGGDALLAEQALRYLDQATPGFETKREIHELLSSIAQTDEDRELIRAADVTACAFELWLSDPATQKAVDDQERIFTPYAERSQAEVAAVFGKACVRAMEAQS